MTIKRTFPTRRLAGIVAAGAVWLFLAPFVGPVFVWAAVLYNAAVLAACVVDYIALLKSSRWSVSRECESVFSVGEPNKVTFGVTNHSDSPFHVSISDERPEEFQVDVQILEVDSAPGSVARVSYMATPPERGDYRFGGVYVRYTTPLGLLVRQVVTPSEHLVKVYPDIFQTKKHLVLARQQRTAQMGLRLSKFTGQGREFDRLRDYVADDPLRFVDWNATARRAKLTTREYDVERSQNVILALDVGRTMATRTVEPNGEQGPSKADCAINACVLLSYVAALSDDRVGLLCFARAPVKYVPPGKGHAQSSQLLEALYALQPRVEESNYYDSLIFLGQKQRKRSLVFLFTDLIDPDSSSRLISAISLLTANHVVVCVALSDYELKGVLESDPTSSRDMYSQAVALNVMRERKSALAQLAARGAMTIDAAPSDLTVAAVNKYLQIKREARV